MLGYQYPVGTEINVLYWDELLVGTGTGLYAQFFEPQVSIDAPGDAIPAGYSLAQNYPNPFNPSTTIRYSLAARAQVKVEIFNIVGQRIATLVDGVQEANSHEVMWDASNVGSGIYFYKLSVQSAETGQQVYQATKKMILLQYPPLE